MKHDSDKTGSGGVWSALPNVTHVYGQNAVTLTRPSKNNDVPALHATGMYSKSLSLSLISRLYTDKVGIFPQVMLLTMKFIITTNFNTLTVPALTIKYTFGDITEILGKRASDDQYVSGVYGIKKTVRGHALIINVICACDSSIDVMTQRTWKLCLTFSTIK